MPRDPINRLGVILGVFVVLSLVFQGLLACNAGLLRRVNPTPPAPTPIAAPVPDAPCDPALPCAIGADTLYLPVRR